MRLTLLPLLALTACNPVVAASDFLAARPTDTPTPMLAALTAPSAVDLAAAPTLPLVVVTPPPSAPQPAAASVLVSTAPAAQTVVSPVEQTPPREPPTPTSERPPTYRMRHGETLTGIAAAHHIPLKDLLVANDYTWDDKPQVGARVVITPVSDGRWIVRRRQTLSQVARTLGVTSAELVDANSLPNADAIFVGQVLVLPTSR